MMGYHKPLYMRCRSRATMANAVVGSKPPNQPLPMVVRQVYGCVADTVGNSSTNMAAMGPYTMVTRITEVGQDRHHGHGAKLARVGLGGITGSLGVHRP